MESFQKVLECCVRLDDVRRLALCMALGLCFASSREDGVISLRIRIRPNLFEPTNFDSPAGYPVKPLPRDIRPRRTGVCVVG